MEPIYLFELGWQQNRLLSVRQSAVAQNIANLNTPNYQAVEVDPDSFASSYRQRSAVSMVATNSNHFTQPQSLAQSVDFKPAVPTGSTHSGNTVNLEAELVKSSEIHRDYRSNTSVLKTFHRMLMASVKG